MCLSLTCAWNVSSLEIIVIDKDTQQKSRKISQIDIRSIPKHRHRNCAQQPLHQQQNRTTADTGGLGPVCIKCLV